ncbi:hypothetical protein KKF55_03890 [Patescibacteria group bacterium]|nr:hypothetical protein [Patescibacteria group bacterium]
MRLRLGISTVLAMLITAFPVLAEPPPYVTGLLAEEINGEIHVGWTSQPDADVAYYRVFYSFESILENEGLFDGSEETDGPINAYVIKDPPPVEKLYIAVIGVSSKGEDINMFVEEVSVILDGDNLPENDWGEEDFNMDFFEDEITGEPLPTMPLEDEILSIKEEKLLIPGQEPPREIPANEEPSTQEPETLRLLSATASSPTEVLLELSGPISVEPDLAPKAFSIVDANGNPLAITYMAVEGNNAVVTTVEQTRERIYKFSISEPAFSPEGLPLDPMDRSAFFVAHVNSPYAKTSPSQSQPTQNTGPLQGIQNFRIGATVLANGYFDVSARWDIAGNRNEIAYYIINQTRDGGKSFGDPQTITSDIGGVELTNVTPGPFGIALSFAHINGTFSPVVFENINLGPGVPPPPEATQQVVAPSTMQPTPTYTPSSQVTSPPHADDLSDSGPITVAASMIIVGSVMGWRRMRRKIIFQ